MVTCPITLSKIHLYQIKLFSKVKLNTFCVWQALELIRTRDVLVLMDSHLEGKFSTEEATALVELASQCLQYEPRDRPDTKKVVSILAPLQSKSEVIGVSLVINL